MQQLRLILICSLLTIAFQSQAQDAVSYEEVNSKSYALYEQGAWKDLINYGKESLINGQDFLNLRLRMGYAAFMLTNFSEAIKQYEKALLFDSYNNAAHYYIYLSRKYLNQREIAASETPFLSEEIISQEKLKGFVFRQVGVEISYKQTTTANRENPMYSRLDIGNRLSKNIHLQQSIGTYKQTIRESQLTVVNNNNAIKINQVEYYNKLLVNVNRKWQLKASYHYVYTPFNNYVYNNHLGLIGVKYFGDYFDIQGDIIIGNVTDSSLNQFNVQLGLYPSGNLNIYSFSTLMVRNSQETGINLKQVIGAKLLKNIWLEANATLGPFTNLVENDGLYLYNSIDPNKIKAGISSYTTLSEKWMLQAGYTFEKRELYKNQTTYNQHSITGGIVWKL